MTEYIDRETAIKAIKNADCNAIADGAESYDLSYLKEIFFNIPAADVVPVVHGWWLHSGYDHLEVVKCSECNHEAFAIALYVCDGNYCPNCGAKMDGGAE